MKNEVLYPALFQVLKTYFFSTCIPEIEYIIIESLWNKSKQSYFPKLVYLRRYDNYGIDIIHLDAYNTYASYKYLSNIPLSSSPLILYSETLYGTSK